MKTEEYRKIWQEAIRLCEMEPNEEEATSFVWRYHRDYGAFGSMDDKALLLTFVGLVVYEQKFHMKQGSTTPASRCYWELLERVNKGSIDKEFVYDVGDWAADYSDNDYVPMGTYRGYGPRRYFGIDSGRQVKEKQIMTRHGPKRILD